MFKRMVGITYLSFHVFHHNDILCDVSLRHQHKELKGRSEDSTKSCSISFPREGMLILAYNILIIFKISRAIQLGLFYLNTMQVK